MANKRLSELPEEVNPANGDWLYIVTVEADGTRSSRKVLADKFVAATAADAAAASAASASGSAAAANTSRNDASAFSAAATASSNSAASSSLDASASASSAAASAASALSSATTLTQKNRIDANFTIPNGSNAVTIGPFEVNPDVTVTGLGNSTWRGL